MWADQRSFVALLPRQLSVWAVVDITLGVTGLDAKLLSSDGVLVAVDPPR
jgi:hypothetical protein